MSKQDTLKDALEWARKQTFQSVAARYAKLIVQAHDELAAALRELEAENERLHSRLASAIAHVAPETLCGELRQEAERYQARLRELEAERDRLREVLMESINRPSLFSSLRRQSHAKPVGK